jgi:hypothetical protein
MNWSRSRRQRRRTHHRGCVDPAAGAKQSQLEQLYPAKRGTGAPMRRRRATADSGLRQLTGIPESSLGVPSESP